MTTGVNSDTFVPPTGFDIPMDSEPTTPQTAEERKGIQEKLLSAALSSIKANDNLMGFYADNIDRHSDHANKSTNLLTRLDEIKAEEGLELCGHSDAEKADLKKIIEVTDKIATATGVEVPACLKKCVADYEASGEVQKLTLNKDELGRLKTLCKSISDRVGKLETQDQMRLNQAQSDHSNTIKWIVNVLNSYQSLIDKIIQMGERR